MTMKVRPTGVTILAVLEILGGVICLAGAAFIGVIFAAIGMAAGPFRAILGAIFGVIGLVIAVILVILGVLSLVIAYGLWTGKGWAWTLAFILAIIGIIMGFVSLPSGIITIIIEVIILYYLTRPHVKEFFGKAVAPPPPPPPPP